MASVYKIIGDILAKYPDLSVEENQVLQDWRNQRSLHEEIFLRQTNPERLREMMLRCEELKQELPQSWEKLKKETNLSSFPLREQAKLVHWWQKWPAYGVAASIVLIAGILILRWPAKHPAQVPTPAVATTVHDAAPGKYQAQLTLSNGAVVRLDSGEALTLKDGTGMRVVNKGGQLQYEQIGEQKERVYNTLSTAKGETYGTVLSDGTKIWLNSQSSIRYPLAFTSGARKVEITGEAYFEVAPAFQTLANGQKEKRSFIVTAGGEDIVVLGTHFDVNSYENEDVLKTTLLEGRVLIRDKKTSASLFLAPGEQAQLSASTAQLSKAKGIDASVEVAWHYGLFSFSHSDLKTVMRQLERWYNMDVVYKGPVSGFSFTGKIPRDLSLSQVLSLLQQQHVKFTIEGKKIIVSQ